MSVTMNKIKITVVKKVRHDELIEKYENPIEHECDVKLGQVFFSDHGEMPQGMCVEAWKSIREFVQALAKGSGNFFDGWMKDPKSAMVSCSDGFRSVSFYIEAVE